jgi:hypothetical protein
VLGFDVMELAPLPGLPASEFAAARLVYHIMGFIERRAILPRGVECHVTPVLSYQA